MLQMKCFSLTTPPSLQLFYLDHFSLPQLKSPPRQHAISRSSRLNRRYLHQRYISRNKLIHSLGKENMLIPNIGKCFSNRQKKWDLTRNNKMKVFHVIFIMKRVCLPFSPPPTSTLTPPPRTSVVWEAALVYGVLSLQRKQQYGGISGWSPRKVHRHTSQ